MRRVLIDIIVLTVLIFLIVSFLRPYILYFRWIVPLVTFTVPALIAGELQGRRTGQQVSSGFAWKVAFATGVTLALTYGLFFAFIVGFRGMGLEFAAIILLPILVIFVVSMLAVRLVFRWGVTFGMRNSPKAIAPEIFD